MKAIKARPITAGILGLNLSEKINFNLGLNAGMINWKFVDPVTDSLLESTGPRNQRVDFDASELFIGLNSSFLIKISESVNFHMILDFDYDTMSHAVKVPDEKFRDKIYKTMQESLKNRYVKIIWWEHGEDFTGPGI